MHRRTFTRTAAGAALATSLAGCLGYDLVSSSAVRARKTRIAAQQTQISELQSTVDERESRIDTLEEEAASLEEEVQSRKTAVNDLEAELQSARTARDEALVTMYSMGDEDYWTGVDRFEAGESHRDGEAWTQAAVAYTDAANRFQSAAVAYDQASTHAADAGHADAADIATAATEAAIPAAEAASLLGQGSLQMSLGNPGTASRRFEDAQEPLQLAIEREPRPPEDFASAI